jgi:DedD protein
MSNNPQAANGEEDIKRKLVLRVAFAGVLIALLLGVLAFIDYLGQPAEEPAPSGPTFTSPVPVPRKEVTQPVKPAEPVAPEAPKEAAKEEPPPPPPVVEAPTQAPPAPAAATSALPARPQVAAQPALPRQESRPVQPQSQPQAVSRPPRSPASVTPAEGTSAASSQFTPDPEKPVVLPQAPVDRQPPAPARLFSGFAVQAGVFSDAQHAEELRAKLTLNGIPSTLEARVQVGPFKTREEAEAARQKLKALGIDGLLLPPKGAKR